MGVAMADIFSGVFARVFSAMIKVFFFCSLSGFLERPIVFFSMGVAMAAVFLSHD